MIGLVLLCILNFAICAWDSFAAGYLWGSATTSWERVIAGCAITIGSVGMLYTFVLMGIMLGYVPAEYGLLANLFLGAPLILAGIVITIQSWRDAIKYKKWWMFLISIWNTFAIFWDIYVWVETFKEVKDLGGISSIAKAGNDTKDGRLKLIIYLVVAVIATLFISIGLFMYGKKKSEAR